MRSLCRAVLEAADCLLKMKLEVDLPVMAAQGFVTKSTEALFSWR